MHYSSLIGIDVQRFTQDPEYKRNTILSLARLSLNSLFCALLFVYMYAAFLHMLETELVKLL
jgi:hypothetical protein